MRSEKEMYDLFLNTAQQDARILAVYMNGSRTNTNVPKDIFQDYDIVYVVKETECFIEDKSWINTFGKIMYMQYPDENPNYPHDKANFYGWLMQFTDGNRIDLHVESVKHALENITNDHLCKVLLNKEGILPDISCATDEQYWINKPGEKQFQACCNEFWWCTNNLAKGLWRKEITYVHEIADFVVRKQLEKMLSWKVGVFTDYRVSVGKAAKYMKNWLEKEDYEEYLKTYFNGNVEDAWNAVMIMCTLFEKSSLWVAEKMNYHYNVEEGTAAKDFLEHVRKLPQNAKEIY